MSIDTSKVATTNSTAATAAKPNRVGAVAEWADDRLGLATLAKKNLRKVFPDHWSFMLGEIALWSFVVLLLSGVFLTLWFNPSMGETTYEGSYAQLRGVEMSEAFASTLRLSFDVRGGLLMRQIHHWSAMLFIARDDDPPAAGLLHRRAPQAARAELGDRRAAAAPRHPRGVHRLLAPRRPALRHRHPRRRRLHQGAADRRHLHVVLPLRRRVPRRPTSSRASSSSTCC